MPVVLPVAILVVSLRRGRRKARRPRPAIRPWVRPVGAESRPHDAAGASQTPHADVVRRTGNTRIHAGICHGQHTIALVRASIVERLAQLEVYGPHARDLGDNAGVLQLLGARNRRMGSEFSDLVGSVNADQIMDMTGDEFLIMVDGNKSERIRRVRYFEQPALNALATQAGQNI